MGRSPCCQKEGLKKGPWTPEEDEKLIAYVKEHGHGNWRTLPKKCGLLRCGKSCRLRWTNYLRPDIKRGLFTHSEEQQIILLHALVGNKWAFIASQLPKRTDNEIKNFWNTVLRKRLHKQSLMISTSCTELQSPAAGQTNYKLKQGNKKSSSSSSNRSNSSMQEQSGMKSSINTSRTSSMQQGIIKSSSHLAQWESARLEAEARLAKESQSSKSTLKLLSFNLGSFSSTPPYSTTTPPSTTTTTAAATTTTTTTTGDPFTNITATTTTTCAPFTTGTTTTSTTCAPFTTATTTTSVAPFPPTTTPFTSFCTTQYPSDHQHYPCTIAHFLSHTSFPSMISPSPSSTNPSSSPILSSASMISLSSQERISSALTLRPNGRLSWRTQELGFTSYSSSQKNSNRRKLDMDNEESENKDAGYGAEIREDKEREEGAAHDGGDHSMMSLPSGDNWQDLLFDGCSDHEVCTAWRSQQDTSHIIINDDVETDIATSLLISNNNLGPIQCSPPMHVPHVPSEAHVKPSHHHHHHHHQRHALDHASYMDLDGITLVSHIDSLLCDYTANQHISSVLKEILWDTPTPTPTPTRLSISS